MNLLSREIRLWNISEYYQLQEKGILHPEEKIELIDGQLIKMSPKGTLHTATTRRIAKTLTRLLANKASVYTQDPVRLNDNSEPEPDVSVVQFDNDDYVSHHPTIEDIYLIIEVADSSIEYDRTIKAKLYGRSGIKDYWVMDVKKRKLYLFRKPNQLGYESEEIFGENDTISLLKFPEITVKISELLAPKN